MISYTPFIFWRIIVNRSVHRFRSNAHAHAHAPEYKVQDSAALYSLVPLLYVPEKWYFNALVTFFYYWRRYFCVLSYNSFSSITFYVVIDHHCVLEWIGTRNKILLLNTITTIASHRNGIQTQEEKEHICSGHVLLILSEFQSLFSFQ